MEQNEIIKKVQEFFNSPQGQLVDTCYGTSDGQIFMMPLDALTQSKKLENTDIITYYRDVEARELAKKHAGLQKMVFATDFLKRLFVQRKPPVYEQYLKYCDAMGSDVIEEEIFTFIYSKVAGTTRRPIATGQKDKIYMFGKGIVEAIFLRRYSTGQVWQVGDYLVFTCPTNTELMSGTYMDIFTPMFPAPVKKEEQPAEVK